jgi:hypothetical protein
MQDRIATMLIIRSLGEIAAELKAVRHELQRLTHAGPPSQTMDSRGVTEVTEMDNAFKIWQSEREAKADPRR